MDSCDVLITIGLVVVDRLASDTGACVTVAPDTGTNADDAARIVPEGLLLVLLLVLGGGRSKETGAGFLNTSLSLELLGEKLDLLVEPFNAEVSGTNGDEGFEPGLIVKPGAWKPNGSKGFAGLTNFTGAEPVTVLLNNLLL